MITQSAKPAKLPPRPPAAKEPQDSQPAVTTTPETREQVFHRLMDQHLYGPSGLKNRYRLMLKTIGARKITRNEADLIFLAVEAEFKRV